MKSYLPILNNTFAVRGGTSIETDGSICIVRFNINLPNGVYNANPQYITDFSLDDFPIIPDGFGDDGFFVDPAQLRMALEFAGDSYDCIGISRNGHVCGTNGYFLALSSWDFSADFCVSREVLPFFPKNGGALIRVSETTGFVRFECPDCTIIARKADKIYPDVASIERLFGNPKPVTLPDLSKYVFPVDSLAFVSDDSLLAFYSEKKACVFMTDATVSPGWANVVIRAWMLAKLTAWDICDNRLLTGYDHACGMHIVAMCMTGGLPKDARTAPRVECPTRKSTKTREKRYTRAEVIHLLERSGEYAAAQAVRSVLRG